ncbi:MAG: hypothetical protein RIC19_12545 [Phaeodactylibacter sp.]|uniref:hypothetical protein n=1 Tax=Phaeodactylibacter sp. TaxID=1940289 RepID=UPI0032F01366
MNLRDLEKSVNDICSILIDEKGYISSIDVLIKLGYLSKSDYELWRFKKVPYLEKVCQVSLKKLSKTNRFIDDFSRRSKLKKSWTSYKSYGKGEKIDLRFSKSNDEIIEKKYATHHVLNKK